MRKRSWAKISRAMGIKAVVLLAILNFVYVMPAVMASGNLRNSISVRVDWPLNDSMIILDSMTSTFLSIGHYLGPPCPQSSEWSDGHPNILWAGNIRLYARDNLEGNQDSPPSANNFRNRHPLHTMVTCQNAKCTHFNKEEGKNIIKYGKSRNGRQRYKCQHCENVFTETYGTHLQYRKLTQAQSIEICQLIVQKYSIRSIERITGHHRDTICRLSMAISENPKIAERILFFTMNIKKAEMDEMLRTIKDNYRKPSKAR